MTSFFVVIALIVSFEIVGLAQAGKPTIPEMMSRADPDGGFGPATLPSGLAPSIDLVLSKTDVVVRGVVGPPYSYLSDDQQEVFTDYRVVNPTFLFQKTLRASKTPGIVEGLTVTLFGGEISVNGRPYVAREEGLMSLPVGSECLFLFSEYKGKNIIVGRYFGAFVIADHQVTPLTPKRGYADEFRGAPDAQVITTLLSKLSGRR
jgi:hypothetical protein